MTSREVLNALIAAGLVCEVNAKPNTYTWARVINSRTVQSRFRPEEEDQPVMPSMDRFTRDLLEVHLFELGVEVVQSSTPDPAAAPQPFWTEILLPDRMRPNSLPAARVFGCRGGTATFALFGAVKAAELLQ